jgi:hypothetical protein
MLSDETTSNIEPRRRRISADSFRTGRNISNLAQGQQQQLTFNNKLINNVANVENRVAFNERKITILKNILGNQRSDLRENLKAVSPQTILLRNLDEIIKTLREEAKLEKREKDNERKNAENRKRRLRENKLEKRYEGLRKTTERILAPVKGVLDRIFQALIAIVGGKFLVGLVSFITNPKNKEKISSAIRFFSDFGPKLLAAYLLFGTRFGRSIGRLSGFLIRGAIRLAAATASLLAKIGIKRAAGVATGLLGSKGKALGTGLQIATAAAGFLSLQNFLGGGGRGDDVSDEPVQGMSGGGLFKRDGLVDGPYGYDEVNARLTDGEFVMSAPAVAAIGPSVLERINEKYGGTNKPRVVNNVVMAQGGGLIGNAIDALNFLPGTGTVMAPMASQGMFQDEGTVMSKFLGMSVPGTLRRQGYSEEDLTRYNRLDTGDPSRFLEKYKAVDNRYSTQTQNLFKKQGLSPLTAPAVRSRRRIVPKQTVVPTPLSESDRNKKFIGESFRDFNKNVETIRDRSQRQREALQQIMPGRFEGSMNLRGMPIPTPKANVPKQTSSIRNVPPPSMGQRRVVVINDSAPESQEVPTLSSPNITLPSIPLPGMNRSKAVTLQVGV